MNAHPFIKWAGGKGTLFEKLAELFPRRIHSYFEPFVGGGAVFYALAAKNGFARAILNDSNKELVDLYRVVRDFPDELMTWLRAREEEYVDAPKAIYEAIRNPGPHMAREMSGPIARAGRFIFLNKAGFNGLYRVNQKGGFNVPCGKKPKVRTFDEENIRACSVALNETVALRHGDFVAAVRDAKAGDLVYFDPPYVPATATSSFTTYTTDGFGMDDQHRLAHLFRELHERGVAAILSNSDTPVVRELYAGFEKYEIQVKRNINSRGDKRGPVGELIIVNRRAPSRSIIPEWIPPLSNPSAAV